MLKTAEDIRQLNERISHASQFVDKIRDEIGHVIIGQSHMLDRLLIGLLSNGHVLLEGVPGLAKTLAIKSLSQAIHAKFSRIQFTPDLLPADVIGTMIYNQQKHEFVVRKGPIFANFILVGINQRNIRSLFNFGYDEGEGMWREQVVLIKKGDPLTSCQG